MHTKKEREEISNALRKDLGILEKAICAIASTNLSTFHEEINEVNKQMSGAYKGISERKYTETKEEIEDMKDVIETCMFEYVESRLDSELQDRLGPLYNILTIKKSDKTFEGYLAITEALVDYYNFINKDGMILQTTAFSEAISEN